MRERPLSWNLMYEKGSLNKAPLFIFTYEIPLRENGIWQADELYGEEEPEGWGERYKGPISKLRPAGSWYVDDPSDRD